MHVICICFNYADQWIRIPANVSTFRGPPGKPKIFWNCGGTPVNLYNWFFKSFDFWQCSNCTWKLEKIQKTKTNWSVNESLNSKINNHITKQFCWNRWKRDSKKTSRKEMKSLRFFVVNNNDVRHCQTSKKRIFATFSKTNSNLFKSNFFSTRKITSKLWKDTSNMLQSFGTFSKVFWLCPFSFERGLLNCLFLQRFIHFIKLSKQLIWYFIDNYFEIKMNLFHQSISYKTCFSLRSNTSFFESLWFEEKYISNSNSWNL